MHSTRHVSTRTSTLIATTVLLFSILWLTSPYTAALIVRRDHATMITARIKTLKHKQHSNQHDTIPMLYDASRKPTPAKRFSAWLHRLRVSMMSAV
jgi:hypothetical protein